jgi:hypothetical protein
VKSKLLIGALLLAFAGTASAKQCESFFWWQVCDHKEHKVHTVPQFDISSGVAALTLLAGGLVVLRGRHRATLRLNHR